MAFIVDPSRNRLQGPQVAPGGGGPPTRSTGGPLEWMTAGPGGTSLASPFADTSSGAKPRSSKPNPKPAVDSTNYHPQAGSLLEGQRAQRARGELPTLSELRAKETAAAVPTGSGLPPSLMALQDAGGAGAGASATAGVTMPDQPDELANAQMLGAATMGRQGIGTRIYPQMTQSLAALRKVY